ncbi:hypothetical protein HG263_14135 [Pseudoalteromonas sp. JBTF-M23]|uniref:Uncharacterized protein n=1 Tax=Pseudoalteromonas caenipelagi TaxID=2726988 RepID=A0A849VIW5_9GAMM|nr:hypothetical protein [Pseudoalteromonas caenipelagi]NOU51671.1 hypothetical protein [Pseudoalteromonas caenipelagi]
MMKKQTKNDIYKSFEQMKSSLFPSLTREERQKSSNLDSMQVGACLADQAIEQLVKERDSKLR